MEASECLDCKTVVFRRFRSKARSALSAILASEAREPHTPHSLSPFSHSLQTAFRSHIDGRPRSQKIRLFCGLQNVQKIINLVVIIYSAKLLSVGKLSISSKDFLLKLLKTHVKCQQWNRAVRMYNNQPSWSMISGVLLSEYGFWSLSYI